MFTYETRAAMADEHRARMLGGAEQARLVNLGAGQHRRPSWLTSFLPAPANRRRPSPSPDRRVGDRRVAHIPVLVERRNGRDRRSPLPA